VLVLGTPAFVEKVTFTEGVRGREGIDSREVHRLRKTAKYFWRGLDEIKDSGILANGSGQYLPLG